MEGDRLTLLGRSLKNNKRRLLLYCLYIVLFVPGVQLSFIEVDHDTDRHMLNSPDQGGNGDKVNKKIE